MQNGESVDYKVVDKTPSGVSQLGHFYMPELLPEEDREMLARMGPLVRWEADEARRAREAIEDEAFSHQFTMAVEEADNHYDYPESQLLTSA